MSFQGSIKAISTFLFLALSSSAWADVFDFVPDADTVNGGSGTLTTTTTQSGVTMTYSTNGTGGGNLVIMDGGGAYGTTDWTHANGTGSWTIDTITFSQPVDITSFYFTSQTTSYTANFTVTQGNGTAINNYTVVQGPAPEATITPTDWTGVTEFTISSPTPITQGSAFDQLVFTIANAAPVIGGTDAGQLVNDIATISPFSAVTITDGDGDNVTTTVTLDDNNKGLFTNASGLGFSGTGPYTSDTPITPAEAQAAIRQLVFDPTDNRVAAGLTETTTFTITVNDGTTNGTNNSTTVVSTSVNDAPYFTAGATLSAVSEDTASPAGATITSLLNANFSDADPSSSLTGIVVTADASVSGVQGDWQYSTDGSTWYDIGTVSTGAGLLLDVNAKLRFLPFNNYNGTPGSLTVYAVDNSAATTWTSGATRQSFDTTIDDATSKVSAAGVAVGTSITAVNDAPTLTAFAAPLDTTNEDTEAEITLAEIQAQGDEADVEDVTVSKFVIKAVSGGTLKIGASSGTALPWAVTTNDTVDAANNAYWTPAANANGTLNAFTVVAKDSANAESTPAVQALVSVTAVNDAPTLTSFAAPFDATDEDVEVEITLAEIQAQGNEADVEDGTVSKFVIKALSSGTLKIGTTSGAATAWTAGSNDTVDVSNNAYWTPAANAYGTLNAFTAVAKDSANAESTPAVQGTVIVTPIADTPSVTNATTNEDTQSTSGLVITKNANDGGEVTHFKITGISGGTLYKAPSDGGAQITDGLFITVLEGGNGLRFTPTANSTADGTFFVLAATDGVGGGLSTGSAQATITVIPVNDAPTVTNLNGDSVSFSIGGNAVALDAGADAILTDIDSTDFNGGNVTASIVVNGQSTEDVLLVGTVGNIGTAGTDVTHTDGFTIGTYTGGTSGTALVVTLNANATVARTRDLISALQYWDSDSATVNTATRSVSITVDDGDGGDSPSLAQNVSVSLVRAPIIDLDGDDSSGGTNGGYLGSFTEDGGAVMTADTDSTISDDGTYKSLTVTLTNRPDGAAESLSSTYGTGAQTVNSEVVTIGSYNSGTGVLAITVDDASTDAVTMQMLMASIRYNNTSNTPDTASRTITYSAVDNDDNAGAVSIATIGVTAVNDPLTGTAAITGGSTPPVVGETLSADASGITDADGLGSFSYQWKRDGAAISGATATTYLLASADTGSAITVTVSYTDGGGTDESTTSAATATVDGDLDGDGIGDASDPDIDGDDMTNVYEDTNGLNKLDASDRDSDLDGDGVTNYNEFLSGSDASVDDYPPLVTPPSDVTVDSTGLFTAVTLGTATAVDGLDGSLTPTSDAPTHFAPGAHTVTWSATDAAGNTGTATQTVNVTPQVSFSKSQTTAEGSTVSFRLILNGPAAGYPVSIPYTVGGTASTDGSDHSLLNGTAIILSGTEAVVSFTTVDDGAGEGTERIVVTMGTPTNAVAGTVTVHTVDIVEGNVAPLAELNATQGGVLTRTVVVTDGAVTVTGTVTDPNPADVHSYDWSGSDNALIDTDVVADTFTFDPAALSPGVYTLRLSVSDGTASDGAVLSLKVMASAPVLSAADDSDSDTVDDLTEGYGDADGDGVADYLDAIGNINVLQELSGVNDGYLIEVEPGLSVQLGNIAFHAGLSQAAVSMADITNYGGVAADAGYGYSGGLFDFIVGQLPVAGQSVQVVLPQQAAIPADARYRKLINGVWQDFVVDTANSVSSAPGEQGYCPPPGDSAYSTGLTEGHWCVQLTLEDGGPNDGDSLANRSVADPGGVAEFLREPVTVKVDSGGGAGSPWLLALLGLLLWRANLLRREEV